MRRIVLVCGIALAATATADGQQSVAGSTRPIGSEREQPTGVVIDNSSLVRAGTASEPTAASADPLLETMDGCVSAVRDLNSIVAETRTGTDVFFDSEWRQRVDDAAFEFNRSRVDFGLVPVGDRYLRAYDAADEALTEASEALAVVQSAIADDQPVFAGAKKRLLASEQLLDRAFAEMRAAHRAAEAERPAPPIDPIAASQAMDELCSRRFGRGSAGFDDCLAEQQAAIDDLVVRNVTASGLPAASFNTIRNNCRFEWPKDFVNRDRCERRRIAAEGGG